MATYADQDDVDAVIGYIVDDLGTSRPTGKQLNKMLEYADSIINAEAGVTSNLTDGSNRLRTIAVSLVQKMVNNLFAILSPEAYAFVEVELTDDQKRIIHMEHSIWSAQSFEVGVE